MSDLDGGVQFDPTPLELRRGLFEAPKEEWKEITKSMSDCVNTGFTFDHILYIFQQTASFRSVRFS